ncbi:hypothetical protein [Puerhibacterium puerhi]|uniref:hypothetical protein n=1 Tax=Puerhibacterium puerhi TaxID=2692623 RepID=UPI0013567FD8|nr:hypothetical protein [Puerhibacterium puerhi]
MTLPGLSVRGDEVSAVEEEVAAVVDVLEDAQVAAVMKALKAADGAETLEDAAKAVLASLTEGRKKHIAAAARAVVSTSYELFAERDWHMVAMRNEGHNLVYGLYGTENAAKKALEKNELGLFGTCGVFPVQSAARRREFIKDAMKTKETRAVCARCGHGADAHSVRKADPKCWGCSAKCPGYVKPEK